MLVLTITAFSWIHSKIETVDNKIAARFDSSERKQDDKFKNVLAEITRSNDKVDANATNKCRHETTID